ncbi:hypothetical protein HAX39_24590 [Citrobacter freundii]|nr:hypothetical protein [Citrobacter freundii]
MSGVNNVSMTGGYYAGPVSNSNVPCNNIFMFITGLEYLHAALSKTLLFTAGNEYSACMEAGIEAQKMSNETNKVLIDVQNQVNSDSIPDHKGSLPPDVVEYINMNQLVISGVTDDGNGNFMPIAEVSPVPSGEVENAFTEGQLVAIKGEFDIEAATYSSDDSKFQMEVQIFMQQLTQNGTEISQIFAKLGQMMNQIVSNMK